MVAEAVEVECRGPLLKLGCANHRWELTWMTSQSRHLLFRAADGSFKVWRGSSSGQEWASSLPNPEHLSWRKAKSPTSSALCWRAAQFHPLVRSQWRVLESSLTTASEIQSLSSHPSVSLRHVSTRLINLVCLESSSAGYTSMASFHGVYGLCWHMKCRSVKPMERKVGSYLRRWLRLTALYGKNNNLQLPFSSITEEFMA